VGTEAGLFQLQGTELVPLGLEEHEIVGVVRLKNGELLASVREWVFGSGNPTLYRTENNEETWEPFMKNFGGEEGKYTQIGSGPYAVQPGSDTLFVTGFWLIRSEDAGINWSIHTEGGDGITVVETWNAFGLSRLLYVDPHHNGRIWIGGMNTLSRAYLLKYTDFGEDWEDVSDGLSPNTEARAQALFTHPDHPDWVMVGLSGAIVQANNVKKSTDGGQSWRTSLEKTGVRAFARSLQHPNVIYAGGRISSGKLYFAATVDFGETWQKEIFEEGPYPITTNDLAVQVIDGQEVLFLGTDRGLYSFELN